VSSPVQRLFKFSIVCAFLYSAALAQEPAAKPAAAAVPSEKAAATKSDEKPALPFQIQLLETHIRFETNGDSQKEVHTIVKLNDLAGARQFSRLGFDYNRAFQQVEIPLVRISHANGGTSEILPSAITDVLNPAVEKFSAYQDVRVKSVRILGLQEGDTLEYRVITTTTKPPLAPNFWLEHTFDRSGQVIEEEYEVDLPGNLTSTSSVRAAGAPWYGPGPRIFVGVPITSIERTGSADSTRSLFRWKIPVDRGLPKTAEDEDLPTADVIVSSFMSWDDLARRVGDTLPKWTNTDRAEAEKWLLSMKNRQDRQENKLRAGYEGVSQKLTTVELPFGGTGFRIRTVKQILDSGYATPEEKCYVLWRLGQLFGERAEIVFFGGPELKEDYPRPSLLQHAFVLMTEPKKIIALDPSIEVAPYGMIPAKFRGKSVLSLSPHDVGDYVYYWTLLPEELPFPARQRVNVAAGINAEGALSVKVGYELRGDNELLLRVAFHQTPKERWKEVAGLLALADGFRGTITNVTASDPMATKDPFTVEYEIVQPKFVDWSKKPVRIPALLPQIALPDVPGKDAQKIELGTPLDVQTSLTLKLPEGTTVQTPAATSVTRDYATFASKYDGHLNTVNVSRHINFVKREIPAERAPDYTTFLRAVQNDQAQMLVLLPPSAAATTTP
jgi:hypothetical protein